MATVKLFVPELERGPEPEFELIKDQIVGSSAAYAVPDIRLPSGCAADTNCMYDRLPYYRIVLVLPDAGDRPIGVGQEFTFELAFGVA